MKRRPLRHFVLACIAVSLTCFPSRAAEPTIIRVALYNDTGVSKNIDVLQKVLEAHADLQITRVKAADIRAGVLAKFDVVIHPGGTGGGQGKALDMDGREQVRTFVQKGGGYVGICAGAYLASRDYPWSLHILDAKVIDKEHWARGFGDVSVKVTKPGRDLLKLKDENVTIYYHQGPLLAPGDDPNIPDYETWGTFAGEIAKNGAPKGVMPGTTAIAAGRFGRGRVCCFSPHPERTEGLQPIVHRGVVWAAGK